MITNPDASVTRVRIPTGAVGKQIHLALEVKDKNETASWFDCRRVVIDVNDIIVKQESIQVD